MPNIPFIFIYFYYSTVNLSVTIWLIWMLSFRIIHKFVCDFINVATWICIRIFSYFVFVKKNIFTCERDIFPHYAIVTGKLEQWLHALFDEGRLTACYFISIFKWNLWNSHKFEAYVCHRINLTKTSLSDYSLSQKNRIAHQSPVSV